MSNIPTKDSRNAAYGCFEDLQEAVKNYEKIHNFCFRVNGRFLDHRKRLKKEVI